VQQQLAQIANAAPGSAATPAAGGDPAQFLQAEAARDPQPVQRWLAGLALSGNTQRSGGAKKAAAEAFNAPGGPASLCKQAVSGRYPFTAGAANDIPLDDFGRLFSPNGMINQFFNQQLRPFVDTSGETWKAQAVAGVAPPIAPADLAQFQRAAAIGDLFFAGGAAQPNVRFDVTPDTLDSGAKQVTLDLDGLVVTYAHGPQRPTSVTWPGANRMNSARLVFDPPPSNGGGVLQAAGPWALFRLFDQGKLQQAGSSDRYTLSFRLGDRQASFLIRAGSVLNPFAPGMLHDFRCPGL
jgi:type VI secretion system protein ImpL